MPSVLFVCTANRYRSPIAAAAFLRKLEEIKLGDPWVVKSAGTWAEAGFPPLESAVQAARTLGLDIANHTSTPINGEVVDRCDLILVMETGQKEAILNEFPQSRGHVFLLTEVTAQVAYDIPDPLQVEDSEEANAIAGEICNLVTAGFEKITQLASSLQMAKEL